MDKTLGYDNLRRLMKYCNDLATLNSLRQSSSLMKDVVDDHTPFVTSLAVDIWDVKKTFFQEESTVAIRLQNRFPRLKHLVINGNRNCSIDIFLKWVKILKSLSVQNISVHLPELKCIRFVQSLILSSIEGHLEIKSVFMIRDLFNHYRSGTVEHANEIEELKATYLSTRYTSTKLWAIDGSKGFTCIIKYKNGNIEFVKPIVSVIDVPADWLTRRNAESGYEGPILTIIPFQQSYFDPWYEEFFQNWLV